MYINNSTGLNKTKIKFRKKGASSHKNGNSWALWITIWAFILSIAMNLLSSEVLQNSSLSVSWVILVFIIAIGIGFDMIGIAFASADETPFHAMAARKVFAAKRAIFLIRNANKVSSFCNDVIGDICGILSGSLSAYILITIIGENNSIQFRVSSLILGAMIAAFTIGGKALCKTFAIQKCNYIVYGVSSVIGFVLDRGNKSKRV